MINKENDEGKIVGIKIHASVFITHLLFVDDMVLFGNGSMAEWK